MNDHDCGGNGGNDVFEGVIIKGVGGAYTVATDRGLYTCNARGVFRNRQESPVVGDRVRILATEAFNTAERTGALQTLLPRTNELRRPRIANVDQIIVTMSAAQPDFNPGLLDRYLLLVAQAGIPAVLCINKYGENPANTEYTTHATRNDTQTTRNTTLTARNTTLTAHNTTLTTRNTTLTARTAVDAYAAIYQNAGYPVFLVSASTGAGLDALQNIMRDKLSVFAGPSGVGKSSLINRIIPEAARETGALSAKIDRGKHTTRHTEILPLQPSGYCADTPGFTSLELDGIAPHQFAALFIEFRPFLGTCRFSDCLHLSEADCAVKAQVGSAIHPARYESYVRLLGK